MLSGLGISKGVGIGRAYIITEDDLSSLKVPASDIPRGSVLVMHELTQGLMALVKPLVIAGIVTEVGRGMLHISVMARCLGIPVVSGVKDLLDKVEEYDELIIDGETGEVYVNPEAGIKMEFEIKQRDMYIRQEENRKYKGVATRTKDGININLWANLDGMTDMGKVLENDAEGVGLFRTESLYMDEKEEVSEEEQFQIYKKAAIILLNKPLVLRTLDIGGDKTIPHLGRTKEENPFLGVRGIRYSLKRRDIFSEQIRAVLRASVFGDIRLMIPMITDISEFRITRGIIEEIKRELEDEDILFNKDIPVGMMIETPAAAISASIMAKEADFFSIGTNDLTQYTMAADRGNAEMAHLYTHYSPAVLRLIMNIAECADAAGIPVGICGEAASDPLLIPFLLALGINELSVNPDLVLEIRRLIHKIDVGQIKGAMKGLLEQSTADEVKEYFRHFLSAK